jgi:hypothetical protein
MTHILELYLSYLIISSQTIITVDIPTLFNPSDETTYRANKRLESKDILHILRRSIYVQCIKKLFVYCNFWSEGGTTEKQ